MGALLAACQGGPSRAKYVFFFIGDGMGVNQVNGTEMFLAECEGRVGIKPLVFSDFPVRNFITTYSAYNGVTCSSAAGTALACGEKTRNGLVGLDSLGQKPLTSIAERAQALDIPVGIITSVGMNHATPAAFYGHQPDRGMYFEIGQDAVERGFDLYGGARVLNAVSEEGADLYDSFEQAGYTVARGDEAFRQAVPSASKILVVQDAEAEALPFAIDRKPGDLALPDMTRGAIDFLARKGDGFFLMAEGGEIDYACHSNDGATVVREVADFDAAVRVAYDFYRQHSEETLIVVTADHETGGMILGTGSSDLNLKILTNQKVSLSALSGKMRQMREVAGNREVAWEDIKALLSENLGFWETVALTDKEEKALKECYGETFSGKTVDMVRTLYSADEPLAVLAVGMLNAKARVSWASGGHSASLVPVYAVGVGAERFAGRLDNTDIPRIISDIAGYGL